MRLRYCPYKTVHDPHDGCPGLADGTAVLAARFFDENQALADRKAGIADWATEVEKQRYIAEIAATPLAAAALHRMYAISEDRP